MEKQFNLEKEYLKYLKRLGVNEKALCIEQRIEMKKAFMAGILSVLTIQRDEISKLPSWKERSEAIKDILNQVKNYWTDNPDKEYNLTIPISNRIN